MSGAKNAQRRAVSRPFKRYPAYKDSGFESLGEVPGHWTVKPLKYSLQAPLAYGVLKPDKYSGENGIPLVRILDVASGRANEDALERISPEQSEEFRRTRLRAGDLVISVVGTIGRAFVVPFSLEGANLSRALARVQLKPGVEARFLEYAFAATPFLSFADLIAAGTAQRVLNLGNLGEYPVAAPATTEQRSIAAFLDRETERIDALVAKKERLIELLQEKRAALIARAITKGLDPNVSLKHSGIEWLGTIPTHWEVKRIRHVVSRIEQGWSPDCESREADMDEWGVLKAGCVNHGRFVESEHKALPAMLTPIRDLEIKEGDLLMSRASGSRELVGSVAVVPRCRPRLLLCDKVFRLRLDSHAGQEPFLAYAMSSRIARWQIEVFLSGGSGLANNIAQDVVKDLVVALPKPDEQRAISAFLDRETAKIDLLVAKICAAADRLKELRTALISAAVTGKIDVREASA